MPYIRKEDRPRASSDMGQITAGELNFMFTLIANDYISTKGMSYQTINDIIGALEGAKLELYRRVVSPYEDSKIKENGDVYTNV